MAIYTILFIVEALIVLIGFFIGLKRGAVKATVRFAELIIVAIASFFIGKWITDFLSDKATELLNSGLQEPLKSVILSAPNAEELLIDLVGALLLPIIFLLVYLILKPISLIGLSALTSLFTKKHENKYRIIGAAVGAATGLISALIILCPFYTGAKIIANVPKESFSALDGVQEAQVIADILPGEDMTPPVSALLVNATSTFEACDKNYNSTEEAPRLISLMADVISSYSESVDKGEDALLNISAAFSATVKHIEDSEYIATITTSLLNSIGESIKNGNDIFGIANGMQGPVADVMLASLGNILTGVTPENIADNIPALTGDGEKYGVISIITEINSTGNIKEAIKDKEKMDKLVDSIITIAENPNLSNTMDAIADIGTSMITENAPEKGSDYHTEYINALSESVNELLVATKDTQNDFASNVETAKDIVIEKVSKTDKDITESEAKLIAICALHSFGTDENYANAENAPISTEDIENFLK